MNYETMQSTLTTESYNLLNGKKSTKAEQDMIVLYIRLSNDDDNMKESNSETNQKQMFSNSSKEKRLEDYQCFINDGYSGTNFNRPTFKEAYKSSGKTSSAS